LSSSLPAGRRLGVRLQVRQSPCEPGGFVGPACPATERAQAIVPIDDVEVYGVVQLAEADGTQVQGGAVALGQMIRAVHQTAEVDAVRDAKHVPGLVSQDTATPPQDQRRGVLLPGVSVERRIVTDQTVDPHPVRPERYATDKDGIRVGPGAGG
jgi:hypothetical protein